MNDDAALLRRFAEDGCDRAFAELVRRHVDLVYGAAMRRTAGDPHLSADIAQHVFTALARNARTLARHTVLPAWLHTATRNAAIKLMISEQRRRVREAKALALEPAGDFAPGAQPSWSELQPLLDAAIDELPEADRTSVILRFFERRSFAEIGAALRVSEDAARMRTERTLEKLRVALGRRGITSTAAALAALVSSQPLISAPVGLAATIATNSLAAAGSAGLAGAFASFMTAKLITTAALSAVIAFVVGSYVGLGRDAAPPPPPSETPGLAATVDSLRQDNRRLEAEKAALQASVAGLKQNNAELTAQKAVALATAQQESPSKRALNLGDIKRYELQRAVLNNLRQIAAARDQYRLEMGAGPASIHTLVGRGKYIKTVRTVGGEDYSELPLDTDAPLTVKTPDGIEVTYDSVGDKTTKPEFPPEVLRANELGQRIEPAIKKAVAAFRAANNNANPKSEQDLLPFFATPQEGADFVEFVEAQKAAAEL